VPQTTFVRAVFNRTAEPFFANAVVVQHRMQDRRAALGGELFIDNLLTTLNLPNGKRLFSWRVPGEQVILNDNPISSMRYWPAADLYPVTSNATLNQLLQYVEQAEVDSLKIQCVVRDPFCVAMCPSALCFNTIGFRLTKVSPRSSTMCCWIWAKPRRRARRSTSSGCACPRSSACSRTRTGCWTTRAAPPPLP